MTTTRHFDLAFSNFRKKAGKNFETAKRAGN